MANFKDWSDGWIKEGHYISYIQNNIRYYEHVIAKDLAHYEWAWFETIKAGEESGPYVPPLLELTKSYDELTKENQIWQLSFGIKGQALIYIELPTDTHRHGIPKVPKPRSDLRRVSHFEEWMSPFLEPSFITEHFMMRPAYDRINFSAYNEHDQDLTDVVLNFFINKMITERVGEVKSGVQTPSNTRWTETLDKRYRGIIPCRPITVEPVQGPAEGHRKCG